MELMDSWKQINLGKSATLKARIGWQGLTTAEYLSSGDYYLVTGTDFLNGFIDWDNCVHVEKERYDQDKYIQLQVDDILVTKDGTIGKVAIVDKIVKPTTLNSGVFVIRPFGKSFYPKYLYYILRSGHFADFLSKLTAGSTINHLYQKDFVHYIFPAPPTLREQKLIAETLSDTDILIQNLKTLIEKKKAIKQGAMQELLTGKKRLKGFYGEWRINKLGEIADIKGGGTPSTTISEFWNGNIDWFTPTEVGKSKYIGGSKRKITQEGFENCSSLLFPKGTVLLTTRAGIGDLAILTKEACTNQGFQSFIVRKEIDNEFIYYRLNTLKSQFTSKASGSTFQEISPNNLKSIEISIPKLNEQKAIAQILSDMDSEIDELETQLRKTQNLKQGMMQELLTGKTRLV